LLIRSSRFFEFALLAAAARHLAPLHRHDLELEVSESVGQAPMSDVSPVPIEERRDVSVGVTGGVDIEVPARLDVFVQPDSVSPAAVDRAHEHELACGNRRESLRLSSQVRH
jgi:hypothetical protein